MKKRYLLAPGPTPVPERVLLALARPIIHHRTAEFSAVLDRVRENLKYLFQTKEDVIIFASSGTGGMEAAVSNLLSPGDKAICVRGGKFGERWSEICEAYGAVPVNIDVEWGKAVDPEVVAETLAGDRSIKAVYVQACETSTGVSVDLKALGEVVASYPQTCLVVDAISALGVYDIKTDDWNIDVIVTGSQKALMLPPGLAFVCVSPKAWSFIEKSTMPKYFFNLKKEKKAITKSSTAYTPAVSLIVALDVVLQMIREEGLENVFARHATLARAAREGVKAMGLDLLAPDAPSDSVTAVKVPEGIDGKALVKGIASKYGVTLAGGQDRLAGKIFRISHMGYADRFDVLTALSAVEMALIDAGYSFEAGAGVSKAQGILSKM